MKVQLFCSALNKSIFIGYVFTQHSHALHPMDLKLSTKELARAIILKKFDFLKI
jgi:hypothetical protein